MRRTIGLAIVVALGAITGCARITMDTPEGFAPLQSGRLYRAVSPEGVRLEAHWVANKPRMEIEFWADTLSHQLREEGYTPAGPRATFRAGDKEGSLQEWSMPLGAERWIYLTGVLVTRGRILVIQAAGESELYARHRASILAALATLRP